MFASNGNEKFFLNSLYSSKDKAASKKIPSAPTFKYSPHLSIAFSIPSDASASVLAIIKKDSSFFASTAAFNLSCISATLTICLFGRCPHLLS